MTADIQGAKAALAHLDIDENAATVRQKSRDFFWYSPVLKDRLDGVSADFVVTPQSEAEVIEVMRVAHAHRVPVTVRGSGTGNYGQAMPIAGGIVLHMKAMNEIREIAPGRVIAGPGTILADLDRRTRAESGQELRIHPSTHNTASLGGFIGGGSTGVGAIRWGGLRATGNILRLRLVTCEAEPRVVDLTGEHIQKANHAYGVNGVITEIEMPLAPAYDWVDLLVGFDDFMEASSYAYALAHEDAILLKQLATVAAPVPHDYFLRHKKFLRPEHSVAVVMVAPHAVEALLTFTERWKTAEIAYRSDRDGRDGLPPAFELCWNHTTLRALRVDPSITYLQVQYGAEDPLASLAKMTELFGDEVPGHTEFTRFDGTVAIGGLPLVRYTTEARLDEINRLHEAHGCATFNPHRYTLEEGGMKRSDPVQLAFKRECDPAGLMNPGKMIAWDDPDWDFSDERFYIFPSLAS